MEKGYWRSLSIRRKVMTWLAAVILVMTGLVATTDLTRHRAMLELDRLQQNNTLCHTVLETLEGERRALEALVREPSQTNRRLFEEACTAAAAAVEALPFDYTQVGEDRYARTWNLRSGYAGYSGFRDELVAMDPGEGTYAARFYQVARMQEDLSVYALRLSRATMDQGAEGYQRIRNSYRVLPVVNIAAIVVALASVCGIFRLLGRSLVRPVLEMSAQSRRIAENDFDLPDLHFDSGDELSELSAAFNRMKHATGDYIHTLREKNRIEAALHREAMAKLELEQNLDRTRLEMLKSQVNPHFLFNTLNMISCMARLEGAPDTDRMILSLSGLFRYNLRTKEQEVWLEQELEALDDYIRIQQTRFDGRITYHKHIQVDPRQARIPSFTLQPLVENAFVHGLRSCEEGGRIFLRIWQEGDMLHVSIADNGSGMDGQRLQQLRERLKASEHTGQGIGLGNISRRIAMLYDRGDLQIYSRQGRGTVIQFRIPQT